MGKHQLLSTKDKQFIYYIHYGQIINILEVNKKKNIYNNLIFPFFFEESLEKCRKHRTGRSTNDVYHKNCQSLIGG